MRVFTDVKLKIALRQLTFLISEKYSQHMSLFQLMTFGWGLGLLVGLVFGVSLLINLTF